MLTEKWHDSCNAGCTDGNWYKLTRNTNDSHLSLLAWADDGWPENDDDQRDQDAVEVSESAFNSFEDICTFAREIGALLACDPVTIIKSIRG